MVVTTGEETKPHPDISVYLCALQPESLQVVTSFAVETPEHVLAQGSGRVEYPGDLGSLGRTDLEIFVVSGAAGRTVASL